MAPATFSADGSVLAVVAESTITLWGPDNNTLGVIIETLSTSDHSMTYFLCFTFALE